MDFKRVLTPFSFYVQLRRIKRMERIRKLFSNFLML
ncbi:hypothetical protein L934_02325 [Helicobacter pylori PZ5080]|uniref:Uncharacterized protein n=1 Tax=Helicobacter pylori PZ5080 TaxID=1337394 RepID=T2SL12_HELPX|nr:hypothetical protein L935_00520 [Helicobacter pylori PZ5086]EQD93078.1 hypothetical protein L934_02325 [Helicobacter pylori PZ5080]